MDKSKIRKLGLIVNPIAGIGGKVGLKGSDSKEILEKAFKLGAEPISPIRTQEFLKNLNPVKSAITIICYPKEMGENTVRECGFTPNVIGKIEEGKTKAKDTKRAALEMRDLGVKLIAFVGGDGTARDIFDSIDQTIPVLGIPSGVKIYSSCFAINPRSAARICMKFLWEELPIREGEVLDIDEEKYREQKLDIKFYGNLHVPYEPTLLQDSKMASPFTTNENENQMGIAHQIIEEMDDKMIYILGPGTTVMAITEVLGEEKSLLGVDLLQNKKIIALDVGEKQILDIIKDKSVKIIVSPLGRQGILFGRGNQQISPRVIREVGINNLIVLATRYKLRTINHLRVDTQDPKLDEEMKGYIRVLVDYNELRMMKVE
ncbi:MAG: ATP-NAD kinase family protein [Candidatus Helarchaeota archaeon]|nr:ATP-NAD kinase family protein [Candidatus Helarchaeota archaeon]